MTCSSHKGGVAAAAEAVRARPSHTYAARTRFGVSKGLQAGSSCWVNLESALALQREFEVLQPHQWFQAGTSEYPQAGSLLPVGAGEPAGMASLSRGAAQSWKGSDRSKRDNRSAIFHAGLNALT